MRKTLDDGTKVYWKEEQRFVVNFDTRKWSDEHFDALIDKFERKSGIAWREEDGKMKKSYDEDCPESVRVQVTKIPNDTKTSIPGYKDKPFDMSNYRKSVVYIKKDEEQWNYAFYRSDAKANFTFSREEDVDYCIIFLQEPRYWIDYDT